MTIAVAMKASSAIQFCGSAIVKVRTGGRKKKFRHATATNDASVDSKMPHVEAIDRMTTRYESATVVELPGMTATKTNVTTPTAATATADRTVERSAVDIPPNLSGNAWTVQPLRGDLPEQGEGPDQAQRRAPNHMAERRVRPPSQRATRAWPGARCDAERDVKRIEIAAAVRFRRDAGEGRHGRERSRARRQGRARVPLGSR